MSVITQNLGAKMLEEMFEVSVASDNPSGVADENQL
jgi:hypothetical protein